MSLPLEDMLLKNDETFLSTVRRARISLSQGLKGFMICMPKFFIWLICVYFGMRLKNNLDGSNVLT